MGPNNNLHECYLIINFFIKMLLAGEGFKGEEQFSTANLPTSMCQEPEEEPQTDRRRVHKESSTLTLPQAQDQTGRTHSK